MLIGIERYHLYDNQNNFSGVKCSGILSLTQLIFNYIFSFNFFYTTFFSNALISLKGAKDKRKQIITQHDLYKELEVTNVIPNGTLRPACPRGGSWDNTAGESGFRATILSS